MSSRTIQDSWVEGGIMATTKKQCPNCHVTLTRYQWSRLWFMSSVLSGRLIQPCAECGTLLRLSAMTLLSSLGALGLLITAAGLFFWYTPILLVLALIFTLVILVGVMGTRVETAPSMTATVSPGE